MNEYAEDIFLSLIANKRFAIIHVTVGEEEYIK